MNNKNHLPVLGVGPFYVITTAIITGILLMINEGEIFSSFKIESLNLILKIIGSIIIVEGIIVWIWAVIITRIDDKIKKNKLITDGIYHYVRNPIYTSFLFIFSGIIMFLNNLLFLIAPILFWSFLTILMINTEEKWLIKKYGNPYLEYLIQTNRCIPFIPRTNNR